MASVKLFAYAAAVVGALLLSASPAFADNIAIFGLTTDYPTPWSGLVNGTTTGTITIDTTTGTVDDINLAFAGDPGGAEEIGTAWDVFGTPPNAFVEIEESWSYSDAFYGVDIVLPVDTLVGYAGGSICTKAQPCWDGAYSGFQYGDSQLFSFASGDLDDAPEPSSLILFGTGALGLVGFFRRRQLQRAA